MRLLERLARGAGVAAIVTAAFVAVPTIANASTPVVGHVYVNDNTAGTNTIGAFDQHADGSLTTAAGSPFAAGGAGTGTVIGSQGSIQATTDSDLVLAVDAGSNQISVLAVGAAAPDPAAGSPVSSGGIRRSASPCTAIWSTWPTRGTARPAATTPGSGSPTTDASRRSPTRRSRFLRPPFPATSCSTGRAGT